MSETACMDVKNKLIVTIVKKGKASKVVAASKQAGAEGGTILLGQGTAHKGIYEKILGIPFELEKEIILTFVNHKIADKVLGAIIEKANLNKPGMGVGFVINVEECWGIVHLLEQ